MTSLDLSRNNLTFIRPGDFNSFPNLQKLNLSTSGIAYIHEDSFLGLTKLEILDLTNNPVLGTDKIPDNVFQHTPIISHIYISGGPFGT